MLRDLAMKNMAQKSGPNFFVELSNPELVFKIKHRSPRLSQPKVFAERSFRYD
jgi:hypothetical protein